MRLKTVAVAIGASTCLGAAPATIASIRTMKFRGANLSAYSPERSNFNRMMDRTQRTLKKDGANAVEIVLECWMPNRTATSIDCDTTRPTSTTGDVTIPDSEIVHAIQTAHKLGMLAVLKPHVDIRNCASGDCFRGDIAPSSWTAWFGSYAAMMTHYARLAQANGVGMLVVGTELSSSQTCSVCKTGWLNTVAAIKTVYAGALTYAANVTDYATFPDWSQMTVLGDDGYFPLVTDAQVRNGQGDPSVSTLVGRWSSYTDDAGTTHHWLASLRAFSQKYGKPLIFTEIGYPRLYGAANFLFNFSSPPRPAPDPSAQADAYQAFYTAFHRRSWFHGALMWDYQGDRAVPRGADTDWDPRGQPAETVLQHWWTLNWP